MRAGNKLPRNAKIKATKMIEVTTITTVFPIAVRVKPKRRMEMLVKSTAPLAKRTEARSRLSPRADVFEHEVGDVLFII